MPAHEALAAVGAAVGGRLRYLSLDGALVPPTRPAAAGALHTLVACYPNLEELELVLRTPAGMKHGKADALTREVLRPAPTLAPLCPRLQSARVERGPYSWREPDSVTKAEWRWPEGVVFEDE